jgi:hypothetical protein
MKALFIIVLCLLLMGNAYPAYAMSRTMKKIVCYAAIVGGILIYSNNARMVPCQPKNYFMVDKYNLAGEVQVIDKEPVDAGGAGLGALISLTGIIGLLTIGGKPCHTNARNQKRNVTRGKLGTIAL